MQLIVIAIGFYVIGQSWGFATDYIGTIYDRFLNGIHLANVTIYPTRIILGAVVFCVLYLVFRAISTSISRHQQFERANVILSIGNSLSLEAIHPIVQSYYKSCIGILKFYEQKITFELLKSEIDSIILKH